MTSLLFGVEPIDRPKLATASAIIALTALAASTVPLARALRVDPAEALRAEHQIRNLNAQRPSPLLPPRLPNLSV